MLKLQTSILGRYPYPILPSNLINSISASAVYTVTKEDLDLGKVDSLSKATCTVNSNIINSNLVSTEIKADTEIPELPTMVLPVAAILGLLLLPQHKRKEK
jgi:hypothetical protein